VEFLKAVQPSVVCSYVQDILLFLLRGERDQFTPGKGKIVPYFVNNV